MPRFRIVEDSVAGSRCFIVYEGQKPITTLWEEFLNYDTLRKHFADDIRLRGYTDLEDIGAIHDTVLQLGGSREQVRSAIEAWLKEKGWLQER